MLMGPPNLLGRKNRWCRGRRVAGASSLRKGGGRGELVPGGRRGLAWKSSVGTAASGLVGMVVGACGSCLLSVSILFGTGSKVMGCE